MALTKWYIRMAMLALGKPHLRGHCRGDIDQIGNSYQNAIGSAQKVVRLVNELNLENSTYAKL